MSVVKDDADPEEAALKWLALAALHGINANAEKISFKRSKSGDVKVGIKYRKSELPSPGPEVGEKIVNVVRDITHIEDAKGKTPLSLGIRGNSIDLSVKVKSKENKESITIAFPD
jgi:hypothetical protein